jgi:hypothetical protein
MKKLRLNLDALDVETFLIDPSEVGTGTIRGLQELGVIGDLYGPASNNVTCTSGPCIESKNSPNCWTKTTSACKDGGSCWNACIAEPVPSDQPTNPAEPGTYTINEIY